MNDLVQVSPAMRFAAHARQLELEVLQARGTATYSDSIEARAIRAARYWESFPEAYSAELVRQGTRLIAAFGESVAPWTAAEYLDLVQACADLSERDS